MNEEEEFEKNRTILLQNCNSNIQTHMGYQIAVIIGSLTLISQWKSFFDNGYLPRMGFYVLLDLILILSVYVVGRMFRWSFLSSNILAMTYCEYTSYCARHEYYAQNGKERRTSKLRLLQDLAQDTIMTGDLSFGLWLARRFHSGIDKDSLVELFILFLVVFLILFLFDSLFLRNTLPSLSSVAFIK